MKKRVMIFLTSLLLTTTSFSQSTYRDSILISKDQLKKTNLIFNDRDRVISLNKNLSEQIVYYNSLLEIQSKKDSLYSLKINNLDSIVNYQNRIIIQKDKKIKSDKIKFISTVIALVGLIIWVK